jgi:hypothetical protein
MSLPLSVATILDQHVTLELECIDRMYLNVMVPRLRFERGISAFFRFHRGHQFASSALMQPMTDAFVKAVEKFVAKNGTYYHRFRKGERKDDIALARLAKWGCKEGVVFVGWAQEKTRVFRTEARRDAKSLPHPFTANAVGHDARPKAPRALTSLVANARLAG